MRRDDPEAPGLPLTAVPYREPREKPRGLDWAALRAPEPEPEQTAETAELAAPRPRRVYPSQVSHATGHRLTEDERADVARRYARGEPVTDLARRYGVSTTTVVRALRKLGVRVRTRAEAARIRWDQERRRDED